MGSVIICGERRTSRRGRASTCEGVQRGYEGVPQAPFLLPELRTPQYRGADPTGRDMASTSDTVPQPRPVISAPAVEAPGARERRRRPSGEPPPLPRSLNTSGRTWLLTAIAALAVCVIVALLPGSSIVVDVIDHRILEGITALRADWLTTV